MNPLHPVPQCPPILWLVSRAAHSIRRPLSLSLLLMLVMTVSGVAGSLTVSPGSLVPGGAFRATAASDAATSGTLIVDYRPTAAKMLRYSLVKGANGWSADGSVPGDIVPRAGGSIVTFRVTLVGANGVKTTFTEQLPLKANTAPVASIGVVPKLNLHDVFAFDGSGSHDPEGSALNYHWSLTQKPLGSTAELSPAATASPSLAFDMPGTYTVSLIVDDGTLSSAPVTVSITPNQAPAAAISAAPLSPNINDAVTLDGTGSSDPDGNSLTYQWTLAEKPVGSLAAVTPTDAAKPSFNCDMPGTYVVHLVVNDGALNSASASLAIESQAAVGQQGGTVQGEGEVSVVFPPNAVPPGEVVPIIDLKPLTPEEVKEQTHKDPPPGFNIAGGVVFDIGNTILNDNADLKIPVPPDMPPNSTVFLVQIIQYNGEDMFMPVDTAKVEGGFIVSQDPPFPGVIASGTYCFLWADLVGWIEGTVTRAVNGALVKDAAVSLSGGYFLDLSDADGKYALPAKKGPFTVNAFDGQTGETGQQADGMPDGGGTVVVNVQVGKAIGPVQSTLVNGDFDLGDTTGWVATGSAGTKAAFGSVQSYAGSHMGFISNGGAPGAAYGALEQTFTVPPGAQRLRLTYNFVSEEYPSFIGGAYNDIFTATLTTPGGIKEIISVTVNNAKWAGPVVTNVPWGTGTGYNNWGETGWRVATVDVSAYAAQDVTLTLTMHDVGDTTFDSYVFLDTLAVETNPGPGQVTTPDVMGLYKTDAESSLNSAGMVSQITEVTLNWPWRPWTGAVVRQSPSPGETAVAGTTVELFVVKGAVMPDVVGLLQADAEQEIKDSGLTGWMSVGWVLPQPDQSDLGRVTETWPLAAAEFPAGYGATIWVATNGTVMPNLVGQAVVDAKAALEALSPGINIYVYTNATTDPSWYGKVGYSGPNAGTILVNDYVQLYTYAGPPVEVPNVVGMTLADATTELEGKSFVVLTNYNDAPAGTPEGTVFYQSPISRYVTYQGAPVWITVPRVAIEMPNLVGLTEQEAKAVMAALSLTVNVYDSYGLQAQIDRQEVVEQWPAAGGNIYQGDGVSVGVATYLGVLVPDVLGMQEAVARIEVENAGFYPGVDYVLPGPGVLDGTVTNQWPAGGRAYPAGNWITLVVATNGTVMPNLIDKSQAEAQSALDPMGLTVHIDTSITSNPAMVGQVAWTWPSFGHVIPGTEVWIGLWALAVNVPDVVGKNSQDATDALTAAGLVVQTRYVRGYPSGTPLDTVQQQQPSAGAQVSSGSSVWIYLVEPGITMPDLVGLTKQEATAVVAALSLNVSVNDSYGLQAQIDRQEVVEQWPAAGVNVYQGDGASVGVAKYLGVPVPNVVGMEEPAARIEVQNAGFYTRVDYVLPAPGVLDGTVTNQWPAGGRAYPAGNYITLVVATNGTVMPELGGKTRAEVETLLSGMGLKARVGYYQSPADQYGRVVQQSPESGLVINGTEVRIMLGAEPIVVPDLLGLSADQAEATVETLGASLRIYVDPWDRGYQPYTGLVSQQMPGYGDAVPAGGVVFVDLAAARTITPPNVVGLTKQAALQALSDVGLRAFWEEQLPALADDTLVTNQTPSLGVLVVPGASITLSF